MIDPYIIYHEPMPAEWDVIPADTLARFKPPRFLFTEAEQAIAETIRRNRWFLVTNLHAAPCSRCGSVHPYLCKCFGPGQQIEIPYNALQQVKLEHADMVRDEGSIHGMRVRLREESVIHAVIGEPVPITAQDAARLLRRIKDKERERRIIAALR